MKKFFISLVLVVSLLISSSAVAFAGGISNKDGDLIISDVVMTPDAPNIGEEVSFAVKIKNIGDDNISGEIPVRVKIDDDIIAYGIFYGTIPANKEVIVNADKGLNKSTWTATDTALAVSAEVNYCNSVAEQDMTNNDYSKSLTTQNPVETVSLDYLAGGNSSDLCDLAVTSVAPNATAVYDEDSTTVAAVIRNLGTEPSNDMVDVTFMVDGKYLETVTVMGAIPANKAVTVSTNVPWRGVFGSHKFTVKINNTLTTEESDFANNLIKSRTTVLDESNPSPSMPEVDIKDLDLKISDVYTEPKDYQIGEQVKFVAVVENAGKDTTNGMFRVNF